MIWKREKENLPQIGPWTQPGSQTLRSMHNWISGGSATHRREQNLAWESEGKVAQLLKSIIPVISSVVWHYATVIHLKKISLLVLFVNRIGPWYVTSYNINFKSFVWTRAVTFSVRAMGLSGMLRKSFCQQR